MLMVWSFSKIEIDLLVFRLWVVIEFLILDKVVWLKLSYIFNCYV